MYVPQFTAIAADAAVTSSQVRALIPRSDPRRPAKANTISINRRVHTTPMRQDLDRIGEVE